MFCIVILLCYDIFLFCNTVQLFSKNVYTGVARIIFMVVLVYKRLLMRIS
jgi:hypothetical protein